MSNWFHDHPAVSIISYTILIAGATWAASTFILKDNRLNLAKSEMESQRAVSEQYRAKTELLHKDIELLRAENQEYKSWLAQSKDALPIIVPQLVELRKQVAYLEGSKGGSRSVNLPIARQTETPNTNTPASSPVGVDTKPVPDDFSAVRTAKLGIAGVDLTTGSVVTVKHTFADQTAALIISFPGQDREVEEKVYAGKRFQFFWGGRTIFLTILEIQFVTDTVKYRLESKM